MTESSKAQCGDAQIQDILEISASDTLAGIAAIDEALKAFPVDARLHFLKGSMLIGEKRFIAAHAALSEAVRLNPEFTLARFQLGFFELTSGEADTARATWRPLHELPQDNYIKSFVDGLEYLIADQFDACIAALGAGIAQNAENPPLNNDMQLIISRCEELLGQGAGSRPAVDDQDVSATSFLLGTARRPKS